MADAPDFYAVLGVSKTASEDEIRKRYRKLAREHHPDVNPGKPEAEEKFKAISAAYDVLSNKEKRVLYDEFGEEGLRGGFDPAQARAYEKWSGQRHASTDGSDVPFDFDLSDLFGGRTRSPDASWPVEGEDLLASVELDLPTALRGTELELKVPTRLPCEVCAGSGARPNGKTQTCPTCHGKGRIDVVHGPMRMTRACSQCAGTGSVHDACEKCQGQGFLVSEQAVRVRIPPGAAEGDELRLRGKGTPGLFGGPPGDIIIRTHVKPHPWFSREGLDLRIKLPITLGEALRGAQVSVPTPGGTVQMKIPPRTQQGAQLRLKGKGVQRGEARGDLYVVLDVKLPDSDDPTLVELLSQSDRFYTRNVREEVAL
jgi:molecular chaperone DnaJ